jgi:hypothetical protein
VTRGNVVVEVMKALGKAFVAGVGVEIAKVAGQHISKRLGPKGEKKKDENKDSEELKAENERLREEVQKLRDELAAAKK